MNKGSSVVMIVVSFASEIMTDLKSKLQTPNSVVTNPPPFLGGNKHLRNHKCNHSIAILIMFVAIALIFDEVEKTRAETYFVEKIVPNDIV